MTGAATLPVSSVAGPRRARRAALAGALLGVAPYGMSSTSSAGAQTIRPRPPRLPDQVVDVPLPEGAERRPSPDYRGRSEPVSWGQQALWVPRIVLAPALCGQ
jgi:hypothetical protein